MCENIGTHICHDLIYIDANFLSLNVYIQGQRKSICVTEIRVSAYSNEKNLWLQNSIVLVA
jgi:hypothetical protein